MSGYILQSSYLAKNQEGSKCWLLLCCCLPVEETKAQEGLNKVFGSYRAD